ncbi:MAG TPA: hypothetical protein VF746_30085 [Longimicrobium sp.]|jgi:hypothetical protein
MSPQPTRRDPRHERSASPTAPAAESAFTRQIDCADAKRAEASEAAPARGGGLREPPAPTHEHAR